MTNFFYWKILLNSIPAQTYIFYLYWRISKILLFILLVALSMIYKIKVDFKGFCQGLSMLYSLSHIFDVKGYPIEREIKCTHPVCHTFKSNNINDTNGKSFVRSLVRSFVLYFNKISTKERKNVSFHGLKKSVLFTENKSMQKIAAFWDHRTDFSPLMGIISMLRIRKLISIWIISLPHLWTTLKQLDT